MKHIPLTGGKHAIVDDEDYDDLIARGKWTLQGEGYAYRWDRAIRPPKLLLMHRVITNAPRGKEVDHINRNKLDNRRQNLRVVSKSVNSLNKPSRGIEESKYWSGYAIRITADGQRIYFGRFKDRLEAMHISKNIKEQLLEAIL